jgi:hypothetical protein
MKRTSLLIALLGASVVSASLIKQNIEDNVASRNLAQSGVQAGSHDLSAAIAALANFEGCEIGEPYVPPYCPPPPPNTPPPPVVVNTCPDLPSTTLPGTGILTAVGTQTAAERTVEHTCLRDTQCSETTTAEEAWEETNSEYAQSCLRHKKKYCLTGCIDYERHSSQHELGEIQSQSRGASCTSINASAGFVGGTVDTECPEQLECPCLDLEDVPEGFCDADEVLGPVVACPALD